MTTDRKSLIFSLAVVSWQKNEYPGIAKLVSRLVWECRGGIRDRAWRNVEKPCGTGDSGLSSGWRKRHKSGFDHRNDHRQKYL